MEENEIMEEAAIAAAENSEGDVAAEEATVAEEATAAEPQEEENGAEESREEACEEINAESFAKTLANPMFAVFARGRSGSVDEIVRDFEKMLLAGKDGISEEMLMKMTPGAFERAGGGAALSERQRRIARDAGMSYREYYEIIRTIPSKTK